MQGRACTESYSTCKDLAASLLFDILLKKRRGVEYKLYSLYHKAGYDTIHQREKRVTQIAYLRPLIQIECATDKTSEDFN